MLPVRIFQHFGRCLEVKFSGETDSKKHGSNNVELRKNSICMQISSVWEFIASIVEEGVIWKLGYMRPI